MIAALVVLTIVSLAQLAVIVLMVTARATADREAAAERATIMQRIQAPQAAVIAHDFVDSPPGAQPPLPDDDAAWHQSREELADQLAQFENLLP